MTEPLPNSTAKTDWAVLLDRIEASIDQALKDTPEFDSPRGEDKHAGTGCVPVADQLNALQSQLETAGRFAASIESLLAAGENDARSWVAAARGVSGRLATVPTSRVR